MHLATLFFASKDPLHLVQATIETLISGDGGFRFGAMYTDMYTVYTK